MKKKIFALVLFLVDFIAAQLVWAVFYELYGLKPENYQLLPGEVVPWLIWLMPITWSLIYALGGLYDDARRKTRIYEVSNVIKLSVAGAGFVILAIVLAHKEGILYAQSSLIVRYFITHILVISLGKILVLTVYKSFLSKGIISYKVVIIGSSERANNLYEELKHINFSLGYQFLGYVRSTSEEADLMKGQLPLLGNVNEFYNYVSNNDVDQVFMAINPKDHESVSYIISALTDFPNIHISLMPDIHQVLLGSSSINHVQGIPLIEVKEKMMPLWQIVFKRLFDIVVSAVVLFIGFPFYFALALITKFTSKGPVFFKQVRIGKRKKPFVIFKYRSMYTDSEKDGPALSSEHDPRITKWGKFMRKTRIDELPQFFNVLIGDMSIVGPRPERKYFIDQIQKRAPYYNLLFRAKPGITSLGQVKYGYAENVDQMIRRLQFDLNYIENCSLALDFRIMVMTALIIVQGRGK